MRTSPAIAWLLLLVVVTDSLSAAPERGRQQPLPESIQVAVVDGRDAPAPRAEVVAFWVQAPGTSQQRVVRQKIATDARGRFELPVSGPTVFLTSRRGDDFSAPTLVSVAHQDRQGTRLRLDRKPAVKLSGA